jgi:hypothetical protein
MVTQETVGRIGCRISEARGFRIDGAANRGLIRQVTFVTVYASVSSFEKLDRCICCSLSDA